LQSRRVRRRQQLCFVLLPEVGNLCFFGERPRPSGIGDFLTDRIHCDSEPFGCAMQSHNIAVMGGLLELLGGRMKTAYRSRRSVSGSFCVLEALLKRHQGGIPFLLCDGT
jgi:hypothetical protein